MGSIRVRHGGQNYTVDEEETGADLKKRLNISPEFMIVNSEGQQVRDNQKVGEVLRDGDAVMPLVQPRYG
jgi:sulfur carrier protein ThiS